MLQTIQLLIEWLSVLLILIGALLSVFSAYGLIRLPDVYLRSHAATKSSTLGVLCVLTGVFLYFASSMQTASMNILLGIVFFFITAPVAGHLNGRAAHRSGVPLWTGSIQDELADAAKAAGVPDAGTSGRELSDAAKPDQMPGEPPVFHKPHERKSGRQEPPEPDEV
ncbi:monovalent cation/H(+) antiporter subunit G [Saccharibacillus sp. JS10]|uniref:monovalent cation/H(+) antiporter subunit G n=1 Tax=Saccharibacillus sp. JS10 TaxID=2950552 RepID=UPI0021098494|nr:monovalent cation/H(+) antiporter subunit G [Saccharibacillus sp. JS10]MCQ4088204.1 monovalent cation/H(+) antiporter subunit G [Saccharibacillus sp. JS10]